MLFERLCTSFEVLSVWSRATRDFKEFFATLCDGTAGFLGSAAIASSRDDCSAVLRWQRRLRTFAF
jgi:hypothetical protein